MKKIILGVLLVFTGMAKAAEVGDSFEIKGLAYDSNYDFNASAGWANRIGAIVTYTSTTFATSTFTDGSTSTGSITVVSTTALSGEYVTINGYKFCAGVANVACAKSDTTVFFKVGANVNATATNLAAAINGNSVIGALIVATASSADVGLVSKACDGVAYALTTSGAKMTITGATMTGGAASTVSPTTDKITILSHGFQTGTKVGLSGTSLPSPFTATDYYVLRVDANNIKLSTTQADAISGTFINILSATVGDTAHTFTLTPAAITGTPSFKWQASNDTSNWVDLAVSSVTMSGYTLGGTSSLWDFSWYAYKWLRLKVTGPTTGGIYLKSTLSVKQ